MVNVKEVEEAAIEFLDSWFADADNDFAFEDRSDRMHLALGLVEHLRERDMLNLTDSAEVDG